MEIQQVFVWEGNIFSALTFETLGWWSGSSARVPA
jgi:hypothetical protein